MVSRTGSATGRSASVSRASSATRRSAPAAKAATGILVICSECHLDCLYDPSAGLESIVCPACEHSCDRPDDAQVHRVSDLASKGQKGFVLNFVLLVAAVVVAFYGMSTIVGPELDAAIEAAKAAAIATENNAALVEAARAAAIAAEADPALIEASKAAVIAAENNAPLTEAAKAATSAVPVASITAENSPGLVYGSLGTSLLLLLVLMIFSYKYESNRWEAYF